MSDMKITVVHHEVPPSSFDLEPLHCEPRLNGLPYVHIFDYLVLEDLFSLRLVRKMTAEETLYFASILINRMKLNLRMPCQLESYMQSQYFGKLQSFHLTHQICLYKDFNEFSIFLNGLDLDVLQILFGSVRHLNIKKAHLAAETLGRIFRATKNLEVLESEDCRAISEALMSLGDEILVDSFASLKKVSLTGSDITDEALDRFLRVIRHLKVLDFCNCKNISSTIENMEQQDLNRIFASVKKLNIGFTDISALALQKLLLACRNLRKIVLWWCHSLSDVIALWTPQELERAFASIRDLDIGLVNLSAEALDRCLMNSNSLKKLGLSGNQIKLNDVLPLHDDDALRQIFRYLEHFEITTALTAQNLRRLFLSFQSLRSLTLTGNVHLSEVIQSLSDEQLHQVFGSVEKLDLASTNIKARALYKILLACRPLKDLHLSCCKNISRTLSYLTQAQIKQIFGAIETLNIVSTNIQRYQLERLLLLIQSIKRIYLSGCPSIIPVLDQLSHEQLERVFYDLDDFSRKDDMHIPEPLFEKWMLATKRYRKYYN